VIQVRRILKIEEYIQSNRLACRSGTTSQRFQFFLCAWGLFPLGVVALPFLAWRLAAVWQLPGDQGTRVALLSGAIALAGYCAFWPLLYRRKVAKLYAQQQLDREWELEFSEECIRSKFVGLVESRLEWIYFQRFIETPKIFLVLRTKRPAFLTVSKETLNAKDVAALRALLASRLEQFGPRG